MQSPGIAIFIKAVSVSAASGYSPCNHASLVLCCAKEGWSPSLILKFSLMSATTGCLAGFVGIGGGLIFSPYFLLMGLEPAVAVATSSTCVIFTASSTTFQYLLTDRVIMSLTLLYGTINLVSSYLGTSLVHCLQDQLSARRSAISGIVSLGVVISTLLALRQLAIEVLL
ncbi:RNF122 [Symbiodinium sp. CCMP2592]|nr:RNF122 [Symbiodinium sp. CCMP2592]